MTDTARPSPTVTLRPWNPDDGPVLHRHNTPEMTEFLGGPETPEKVDARHERYLRLWASGEARMFTVWVPDEPQSVASVGYWRTEWRDEPVLETGWGVEPPYQGRGIAKASMRAMLDYAEAHVDEHQGRGRMLAFPKPQNLASNALCRALGFEFVDEEEFEYPTGTPIHVNAWVYTLTK